MNDYKSRLKNITTFVFDCDGVLTDGKILFTDDGQKITNGYVRDGYVLQLAKKKGYLIAVISGGLTPGMKFRFDFFEIEHYLGVENKKTTFLDFVKKNNLTFDEILFMGDDIPDYEVMQLAGVATCPADACRDIKKITHYISPYKGGEGCVRDVVEQVLRAKNQWMDEDAFSW